MSEKFSDDEYIDYCEECEKDEKGFRLLMYVSSIIIFVFVLIIGGLILNSCTLNLQNVISTNSSGVADDTEADTTSVKTDLTIPVKSGWL